MDFKIMDLIKYYFKNIILALTIFIISFEIECICINKMYAEKYVGETTIILGASRYLSGDNNSNNLDVNLNKNIIENYIELAKSEKVMEKVIEKENLEYSASELKQMIDVYKKDDTECIVIEATSTNKEECGKISYAVYETLKEEVERIFEIDNIYLIDTKEEGTLKYGKSTFIKLALIMAFLFSFCIITVKFLFFYDFNVDFSWKSIKKIKMLDSPKK